MEQEFIVGMMQYLITVGIAYKGLGFAHAKYKIKRDLSTKYTRVYPPLTTFKLSDVKRINPNIKKEYLDCINHFIEVVKENMPYVNLDAFYENAKTLVINEDFFIILDNMITGNASDGSFIKDSKKSMISIRTKNYKEVIYHELLHMASSRYAKMYQFDGFFQEDYHVRNSGIGNAINEGFTELLNIRYFTKNQESDVYRMERTFASAIETIVGKDNMEDWYFKSDLYSLFETLKRYDSEYQVIRFFKDTDFLNDLEDKNKSNNLSYKSTRDQVYTRVILQLFKWYLKKLISNIDWGSLKKEEALEKFNDFVSYLLKDVPQNIQDLALEGYYSMRKDLKSL